MITSPLWLPVTLAAGLFQAWRTAVQRRVSRDLSVNAASFVRYFYGLPFALILWGGYSLLQPQALARPSALLLFFCAAGGAAQIVATNLLLMAFQHRGFVVGTAFSKTEAVQGALLSLILLGERLSGLSWLGVLAGVAGVMILSGSGQKGARDWLAGLTQPAARYGIASGFTFALAAVGIRRATGEVGGSDPIHAALVVLALTVSIQVVMQGTWLAWRERAQFGAVLRGWRNCAQVGLLSSLGSACWFTGFAMAPVALVRVVGQVEVLFTMGFAHFYLRERIRWSEALGLLLVAAGVVLALAGAW